MSRQWHSFVFSRVSSDSVRAAAQGRSAWSQGRTKVFQWFPALLALITGRVFDLQTQGLRPRTTKSILAADFRHPPWRRTPLRKTPEPLLVGASVLACLLGG